MNIKTPVVCIGVVLSASAAFSGSVTSWHDVVFYEGNSCTQDRVFTYDSRSSYNENCQVSGRCKGDNDEARSVLLKKAIRVPLMIKVYDSPQGSTGDDYTVIQVNNTSTIPPNGLCVKTFEKNMNAGVFGASIFVTYKRVNGLDGKVSRVKINRN